MSSNKKVVIIGYVWPEPKSSAAGLREMSLIQTFQEAGWIVIYFSPSKDSIYRKNLELLNIRTEVVEANDPSFDALIKELAPDCVIFDRFVIEEQFAWRVSEAVPQSLRILDTQDLHFLRRERMRKVSVSNLSQTIPDDLSTPNHITEDKLREIAAIYRSDLTLILSDFEICLLKNQFNIPDYLLHYLPFQYPNPQPDRLPRIEDRNNFVMIGNFRHPPNHDGALWFVQKIWSLIRTQLPSAEVHLYGAYAPREITKLHQPKNGVFVKGWAEDQYQTLQQYRVNLAPLRFGAGIKGKITDGWLCGTPVVTTSIGAEGMSAGYPWGGKIVSMDEEKKNEEHKIEENFALASVDLYTNTENWYEAQKNGFNLIENVHSHSKNAKEFIKKINDLLDNRENLRNKNFIGSMLNFHQHRSTKYFSKWIELKQMLQKNGIAIK